MSYVSPEQTGRTGGSVDARSDLYSLGVVLYQLLAGSPPFAAESPLELMACHLAAHPPSLEETPEMLRRIVMRLLSKAPEDRYQSAWGLRRDLERCLEGDSVEDFPLGQKDIPSTLHLSQKLYGRERQVGALREAWERVLAGAREVVLLAGYSGIGKTSLARALYPAVTLRNGHLVWGKNEQYTRHLPYAAPVAALRQLVRHWMGDSEDAWQARRERLRTNLGRHGRVILDSIPELEAILEGAPPLPEVSPSEAQHRFDRTWVRFLRCCCSPEEPLVLFVDDLQWADPGSLRLLQTMMTAENLGPLLLIGAYRENEVDTEHGLPAMLERLRDDGCTMTELRLEGLQLPHIVELLSDSLHLPASAVEELAELIERKTAGNPLFVNSFLRSLESEALLAFDAE
jgi:predicted ATPase